MDITRRNLIAGAAVAAGTMVAGTALAETVDPAQVNWDHEADVVVVGCGSGGSPAAVDAFDAGNEVIIVEKQSWLGGSMRRCGGGIAAPNTCIQKALGVEDDVEDFYGYIVACGEGLVDEEMLRVFADRAQADFDWYVLDMAGQSEADWAFTTEEDQGLEVSMRPGLNLGGTPVYFEHYGYKPVPRCYWFHPNEDDVDEDGSRQYAPAGLLGRPDVDEGRGGTGLWKPMQDAIDARGIPCLMRTSLVSLVKNGNGEVVGAKCRDLDADTDVYVKARKGVVIATGDWENNAQMLLDYTLTGWAQSAENDFAAGNDDPSAHNIGIVTGGWANAEQGDGAGILAGIGAGAGTALMAAGPWRGGLKTDIHAQVLDVLGEPIPRLFASSYAVSGKFGLNYPHCGLHNMWNISFGCIAAESVSALEPWE